MSGWPNPITKPAFTVPPVSSSDWSTRTPSPIRSRC